MSDAAQTTDEQPTQAEIGCPDSGTCHHGCQIQCWRVQTCSPLSIAKFPKDRWPDDVRIAHGAEPYPETDAERAERYAEALRWIAEDDMDATTCRTTARNALDG